MEAMAIFLRLIIIVLLDYTMEIHPKSDMTFDSVICPRSTLYHNVKGNDRQGCHDGKSLCVHGIWSFSDSCT